MKLYLVKNKTLPKCYLGQEDISHEFSALWNNAIEIMVRGLSHWNYLAFVRNTILRHIPDMMNQNWWDWAWESAALVSTMMTLNIVAETIWPQSLKHLRSVHLQKICQMFLKRVIFFFLLLKFYFKLNLINWNEFLLKGKRKKLIKVIAV